MAPGTAVWWWERLEPELARLGHRAVTVDLPCDDPAATFSAYADVVASVLAEEQGDLVLVGHSLAGLTIPIAAERLAVQRMVFVCALIADPGRSFADQLGSEPDMLLPTYRAGLSDPDEHERRAWIDFDVAADVLYDDCDDELARSTFDRLRPQATGIPYGEPCPLDKLPDVERSYVACTDDRLVNPAWTSQAVPERLGIEPVELPGSHFEQVGRQRRASLEAQR